MRAGSPCSFAHQKLNSAHFFLLNQSEIHCKMTKLYFSGPKSEVTTEVGTENGNVIAKFKNPDLFASFDEFLCTPEVHLRAGSGLTPIFFLNYTIFFRP